MIAAVETKFAVGDRVRVLLVNPLSGSLRGKEFEIADTSLLSKGQVSIRTGKKSTWPIEIRELELVEKAAQDLSIVPSPFAETYEAEGQAIKQEMEQPAPATLDTEISSLYRQATEAEATAEAAGLAAAQLYWSLGEKLTQKKAELGHGNWLPFLEATGIDKRKAQRAMQLNSAYPKSDSVTHLTLTQALAEVQTPKAPQITAPPLAIQRDLGEAMDSLRESLAAKQQPPDLLALRESDENYTRADLIEAVRRVLGQIDLDPASCSEANATVKAAEFCDRTSNGLAQPWHGCIWLNAPYSYPLIELFTARLIDQWQAGNIAAALTVVNNCTDTGWFQALAAACTARLDLRGRHQFHNPYRSYQGGNRQGQCLFYFGQNPERFYAELDGAGQFYPPPSSNAPALPASPKPLLVGALAELRQSVLKIAGVNGLDLDEATVDAIAAQLLKTLEENYDA